MSLGRRCIDALLRAETLQLHILSIYLLQVCVCVVWYGVCVCGVWCVCVCVCVTVCVFHGTHVKVRGQWVGVRVCESQESNSDFQAWWQVSFLTEPSQRNPLLSTLMSYEPLH